VFGTPVGATGLEVQ